MRRIFILIALVTLASCGSSKKSVSSRFDKLMIENLANFTAEEIKNSFPNATINEGTGMFEEGTVEKDFTVLYPETPNEIHITWTDNSKTKIDEIRFSDNGKWKSKSGIKIGTTYSELNKMNGKPISFYGFGWDYSGAVLWNDGKLENGKLRVFIGPDNEVNAKYYGDRIIKATPEEIEALDLKVQTILLHLGE
ncbi:hypothetical protein [Gillisia sp. Hel_I_29]|uniref:hypothetical protein n=1 Tax=Gillisia sp. Hel_I_29 TaxID=1249975 RepID=UPI000558127D|nr:hypothetical protein [Gillisia sp. Hel_I_29]